MLPIQANPGLIDTNLGCWPGLGPYLVGGLVLVVGLSLGGTKGYTIHPARDLGPRTAQAVSPIAGKGNSGWGYAAILGVGPLVGASLGSASLCLVVLSLFHESADCSEGAFCA